MGRRGRDDLVEGEYSTWGTTCSSSTHSDAVYAGREVVADIPEEGEAMGTPAKPEGAFECGGGTEGGA
jgi:hypothetical protein